MTIGPRSHTCEDGFASLYTQRSPKSAVTVLGSAGRVMLVASPSGALFLSDSVKVLGFYTLRQGLGGVIVRYSGANGCQTVARLGNAEADCGVLRFVFLNDYG